ncbi:radical SAM protein [Candidatus Poribacteria bacterium]|nr:radical SAM protein [Candidatus Poribacteria bacterium]
MKVCEIFYSIQGESTYAGLPCVFVRTSGCNLRCLYCDTRYAYEDGQELSIDQIIEMIESYDCNLVEITGGEPLLQLDEVNELIKLLLECNYTILIETNGSLPVDKLDHRVVKIMDIKCPGSAMQDRNLWENINYLDQKDQVKFVISHKQDYIWVLQVIKRYELLQNTQVLLSPVFGILEPCNLVEWMLKDKLKARFQLQIHKYIWSPRTRGV